MSLHTFGHVAHVAGAPTNVRIARTESGADAALEIESTEGTRTILRFRTEALPEIVDGVAHFAWATQPAGNPAGAGGMPLQ